MEKKMETTIEYWGNIGLVEKKKETTTSGVFLVGLKV